MPKDKDLKHLARRRMEKTGESYTVARAQLLAKRSRAGQRLTEPELAELAGLSTEAVAKATNQDWGWWLEHLDGQGSRDKSHREITRYLEDHFEISSWWVQSVAVGYERIVGLREIGQGREGSYSANKSKTFPVPVEVLFRAFDDDARRSRWLEEETWTVRTSTPARSLRVTLADDLPLDLWFVAKGDAKSSVQIQQRKLPSKDAIEAVKARWTDHLAALGRFLTERE